MTQTPDQIELSSSLGYLLKEASSALRAAMEAADFTSLRGDFAFNSNHYPTQNFYQLSVEEREDGQWATATGELVFENYGDNFAGECSM